MFDALEACTFYGHRDILEGDRTVFTWDSRSRQGGANRKAYCFVEGTVFWGILGSLYQGLHQVCLCAGHQILES